MVRSPSNISSAFTDPLLKVNLKLNGNTPQMPLIDLL